MKEITGDLWVIPSDAICITTNGYVKANGRAVMGRGCALEAKQRLPDVDKLLGAHIKQNGNHVTCLGTYNEKFVLTFPVKHNWWEEADIELIKRSCIELVKMIRPTDTYILPRPGCGNGRLKWEEVKKAIAPLLPDNVLVISK